MKLLTCVVFAAALAAAVPAMAQGVDKGFSGTVLAYRSSTVNAKVIANVAEVAAEEGQLVKEGQMLARLDNEVARLQSSVSDVAMDNTTLYESAVKAVEQAKRDLTRAQGMDLSASKAQVENAQLSLDVAEINVRFRKNELEQARVTAELRRAEVEQYYVRAPFDGVVAGKYIEVGESTNPIERRLFQVIDISKVYVSVPVETAYFMKLTMGQEAAVKADNCPGKTFKGKVTFLAPAAEPGGRHFLVKVLVDNPDGALRAGTTALVTFAGVGDTAPASGGK